MLSENFSAQCDFDHQFINAPVFSRTDSIYRSCRLKIGILSGFFMWQRARRKSSGLKKQISFFYAFVRFLTLASLNAAMFNLNLYIEYCLKINVQKN